MTKFIHLTDAHIVARETTIFGVNSANRLKYAVDSINSEHSDAAFTVVTGDLTDLGDAAGYAAFTEEINRLTMPVTLMVGNHDDTNALVSAVPDLPLDPYGFVQTATEGPFGRCLFLDTRREGSHTGQYCEKRRKWLSDQLNRDDQPVLLFMHHPPFDIGIAWIDAIKMQDHELFHKLIAPHKSRIRHLFLGHAHRSFSGNWRGISFTGMRGLCHQVALRLSLSSTAHIGNLESPAYGVVLVTEDTVVEHLHDYSDQSSHFDMQTNELV